MIQASLQIRCCAQSQEEPREQDDGTAGAIETLLVPWLAFQNQSELAAEALVEAAVGLYRSGWTVQRVQLEMTFLTLKTQREEIKQVQELDSEMLLSFICLIMITCKVLVQLRCLHQCTHDASPTATIRACRRQTAPFSRMRQCRNCMKRRVQTMASNRKLRHG